MYHHIAPDAGFYTVAVKAFEEQMSYLSQHCEVVDVPTYLADLAAAGKNIPGRVAITFDDAFCSYKELALPVMDRYGLASALFVATDFLGRTNEWDAPANRHPIMNDDAVKQLAQHPLVTIGAHSAAHRPLAGLAGEVLAEELRRPKQVLEELAGKEIAYLAYPFGQPGIDFNRRVIEAVKLAGYRAAFSTDYAISNRQKDCFALHRVEVGPKDDLQAFKARFKSFQARSLKQSIKNFIYALKGS